MAASPAVGPWMILMRGRFRVTALGWRLLAMAVLAAAIGAARSEEAPAAGETAAARPDCSLEPGPRRAVVRVIDAETIELDDGTAVRLIGALAPRAPLEPSAPGGGSDATAWPPEREAEAALKELVAGATVELGFSGRRTDRYGRLVAQVFRVDGETRRWVQGELLANGHARAYGLPQSFGCSDGLLAQERIARQGGLGLWRNAAYAPRAANDWAALRKLRSTYQLVTGTVHGVRQTKATLYLNFGPDWRRDFSAVVPLGHADRAWTETLAGLAGKTVTVRGWVERRGGAFITINDASQIEVLDDATGAVAADTAPPAPRRRSRPRAAVPPAAGN